MFKNSDGRDIEYLSRKDLARVELTVVHPTLEPDYISQVLALNPVHVMIKGETIYRSDRYHIRSDATYWTFSSPSNLKEQYADAHLNWLLDRLFGILPSIRKLQKLGAEFRLSCHIETWSGVAQLTFDGDILQRLAQLRLSSVRFTSIYKPENECEDEEDYEDDYEDDEEAEIGQG